MEITINITEEQIKSAIERHVRTAIADRANYIDVNNYIKKQIDTAFYAVLDKTILEIIGNKEDLTKMVHDIINRRAQKLIKSTSERDK